MRIKGHFHTWKICVSGVFWKPFYEDDILPEIQVPPPAVRNSGSVLSSTLWDSYRNISKHSGLFFLLLCKSQLAYANFGKNHRSKWLQHKAYDIA